jgi:FOG: PKD repeat
MKIFKTRFSYKISLVSAFFLLKSVWIFSQLSEPGIPESFLVKTKAAAIIPALHLDTVDQQKYLAEDAKYSIPNRYGIVQQLNADIKEVGVKTKIVGRGTIWQYRINSYNAFSLGVRFSRFHLPDGAKVFIYNDSHDQILGAFTSIDNSDARMLSIAEFKGSSAIIEYFEPESVSFSGELVIGAVSQAYKDIQAILQNRIGINCPEGANWQDDKHAVCRMIFGDYYANYYCTGFLVNNVRLDGTPYFQTANHCISTSYEASTLVTYYNYENSTCSGNDASALQTLSGATLKANSSYSDFSLLLLKQYPPAIYKAYYAGWDVTGAQPLMGTCIHHPEGTPKCISLQYGSAPVSYNYSINWDNNSTTSPNTHWEVIFNSGNVEGGSSGSPLFDQNHRVIGQLHGGDSISSFYGKNSVSWNYKSSSSQQLKAWLDPDNTGTKVLDGTYMQVKPLTLFSTPLTNVCVGQAVQFTDQSKYLPTQWKWRISPNGYKYAVNTDSTFKSPYVIFENEGVYSVELITSNSYGQDTLLKSDYVVAKKNIQVSMSNIPSDSTICGCLLSKYLIQGKGALNYSFSVDSTQKLSYSLNFDSIYLTLKQGVEKYGPFSTWLRMKGTFGSCAASDSVKLKVLMQTNNDIANAIQLWPGTNPVFSNVCATTQTNEPNAPTGSCYSSESWCNNYPIKNTVWFTFIAPSSGLITIDTHGINNRMAIYNADFYSDIVSGNGRIFSLVAANEGRSSTDGTSLLERISVQPGKKYWLQLDGSKGTVGNFTIDVVSNTLNVYPNPSNGQFDLIISNESSGTAYVEFYNLSGKLLFRKLMEVTPDANRFSIDATSYPAGMYLVKVNINGTVMKTKMMIFKP